MGCGQAGLVLRLCSKTPPSPLLQDPAHVASYGETQKNGSYYSLSMDIVPRKASET